MYCHCLFFAGYFCSVINIIPLDGSKFTSTKSENNSMNVSSKHDLEIPSTVLSKIELVNNVDFIQTITKARVKRQSSGGKFVETAQIPQLKLVRLFLQMFKNLWDEAYIGGAHPFHPNVPKTVMELYKQKIVEFFIPDIEAAKT